MLVDGVCFAVMFDIYLVVCFSFGVFLLVGMFTMFMLLDIDSFRLFLFVARWLVVEIIAAASFVVSSLFI